MDPKEINDKLRAVRSLKQLIGIAHDMGKSLDEFAEEIEKSGQEARKLFVLAMERIQVGMLDDAIDNKNTEVVKNLLPNFRLNTKVGTPTIVEFVIEEDPNDINKYHGVIDENK